MQKNIVFWWRNLCHLAYYITRVDFMNTFTLYAKLRCSTPSFGALRQAFTPQKCCVKALHRSLKLGKECKCVDEIDPSLGFPNL